MENKEKYIEEVAALVNGKKHNLSDDYFSRMDRLAEAKRVLNQSDFTKLLALGKMHQSTSSRHISNANCPRLKKYREELQFVDNWDVINSIRKLSESEFEAFKDDHLNSSGYDRRDDYIDKHYFTPLERQVVERYRKSIKKSIGSPIYQWGPISINFDHPTFTADKLKGLLQAIVKQMPYCAFNGDKNMDEEFTKFLKRKQV